MSRSVTGVWMPTRTTWRRSRKRLPEPEPELPASDSSPATAAAPDPQAGRGVFHAAVASRGHDPVERCVTCNAPLDKGLRVGFGATGAGLVVPVCASCQALGAEAMKLFKRMVR